LKKLFIPLIGILVLLTNCSKEEESPEEENLVASASATIDGNNITFKETELNVGSIFPAGGGDSYTGNTVKLIADNGLIIEIKFSRENTGTRQITEINNFDAGAIVTDTNNNQYNAFSGTIDVTKYESSGLKKETSGTFNFTAVYYINFSDSLVMNVENGVFNNMYIRKVS
jgi:hypothetical protein